ncbi:MAG TPA: hypothetical protein DCM54_06145 [Gammaproteobacteria bacterium]|nr:hypothetical protein [Gammaproteobacteria bacterium]
MNLLQKLRSMVLLASVAYSMCASADRLNVLFITVDDMNRDSIGVYGAKVAGTTPNIDQLAAEGLRFEHAHVTIAICQPTRAVWMTGRYPQNNGALGFDEIRAGIPTLPETLRENGFYTGILSKTNHVVPSRENAFDYSREQREMSRGRSPDLYGKFVAEFLQHAKKTDRPFFLMVNADDPHRPFDDHTAAAAKFPPSGKRKFFGDFPVPSRVFQAEEVVVPGFLTDIPPIRTEIAMYYSSVRRADDLVGRVLKELAAAGFDENTVVMLKSDHGIAIPFAKTNVYRHSTITPWIIRWPNVLKPGSHETEHLVSGIDVAPTILDILGIDAMEGMDGRSLLPVLKGERQDGREFVYTQINKTVLRTDYTMRSIQGKRFGLIWNAWSDGKTEFVNESMNGLTWNAMVEAGETDPEVAARVKLFRYRVPFEFYDYQKDPDALNNLIDDPASSALIKEYRTKLAQHMRETGDVTLQRYDQTLH